MNFTLRQKASIRWTHGILYSLLLLAVPVSLPLGMVAAAMGAWFAIQGGSLMYLPIGLLFLLAGIAVVHSRSVADFILVLLSSVGMIAWLISGSDAKSRILNSMVELSGHIDLLLGLLVIMVMALFVVHWKRPSTRPAGRSRLVWVAIPLLGTVSFGSFALAASFVR